MGAKGSKKAKKKLEGVKAAIRVAGMPKKKQLCEAAASGDVKKVRSLLKGGKVSADLYSDDTTTPTPLHLAAQHGHAEVIQALVENGADVSVLKADKSTPLHLTARPDHGGERTTHRSA